MPNWKKLIVSGSDATLNKLNVSTAVTASFFKGDGSGLSNVSTTIAEIASKPDTFSNTTSKVITHNFGSKDVIVSVFDSTDNLIIPESIVTTDDNNVTITFAENTTGRAVVARGGHIVSGTVDYNQLSNVPTNLVSSSLQLASDISGSFTATSASFATTIAALTSDYTELTNVPGNIVSSSTQLASDISGSVTALSGSIATRFDGLTSDYTALSNVPGGIISSSKQLPSGIISSSQQLPSNIVSSSIQLGSNISGSFTSTSASLASAIANITSDYTELTNIPGGILSSSAQLINQNIDLGTGHLSASNIQIEGLIRRTGDSNTFLSMSDDHMSFTVGNSRFIDYHEGYNGVGADDRLIINPDKISNLDFYVYGNSNNEAIIRTQGSSEKLWIKYQDDEGNANNQIDRRISSYYKGVNIRSNVLIDENKLYIKGQNLTNANDGGNIILQRINDTNIGSNEVLGGILFSGDDTDAPISGSVGFAIQARAKGGWVSGSYPTKLVFYSGEKGHENWPDQGIFRVDPDGKTHVGADTAPQEMLWVSGSIESYVEGSHISASRVIGESITGSLDYSNVVNLPTLVSSSNQLASDISGSITLTSASLAGGRLKNTTDTLTGNLTVTGTINATKINTTIVSSSIAFSSGSNIFGDEASDEHEFTGSIDLTGPITASFLKGDGSALTNLTLSSGIISSSQQLPSGIISSSQQFPSSIISSSKQLPSGIISSSQQLPSNIVSSSAQLSEFSGSFSGSFEGDGSALTNITAQVTEQATVTDTFSSVTSKAVTHDFGTKNVIVSVYDSNDQVIIPASITTTNVNVVTVTFATATSGRVVVAKGGHIVSGSIPVEIVEETTVLDTFTSSTSKVVTHNFGTKNVLVSVYDNTDKMIIPQEIVTTDVNTVTITLATATTGRVIVAKGGHLVSGSSEATVDFGAVGSHILPSTTEIYDLGSSSKRWRDIYLSGSTIDLGGTKITRDGDGDIEFKDSNNNLKKVRAAEMVIGTGGTRKRMKLVNGKVVTTDDSGNVEHPATASHALTASFVQDSFISASAVRSGFGSGGGAGVGFPFSGSAVITGSLSVRNGTISGSFIGNGSALTGITTDVAEAATFTADFTNAVSGSFTHNFGTKNVIVQCYFSGSDTLFFPDSIRTTSVNLVDVTFSSNTSGRVVIAKGGHMISSSLNNNLPGITGSGFTNSTSTVVNHGFGTKEVVVSVYDSGDNLIMPSNIKTTTDDRVDISFAQPRSGRVVVSKGGHVVTSTTAQNAISADSLTTAGNRQGIVSVTTAVTASLFSTHLLRGHISMSLPSAEAGDWIKVSNRITSSYAHLVPGGTQKIMGSTESLEVDNDNAGFELIYADSTDGWIIIGN